MLTDVSEAQTASIITLMIGSVYETTQCYIPEDSHVQA
jgi:hypothetical protein